MARFALAGSGAIAAVWAQLLSVLDGHQLEAVGSRDPARADGLAKAFSARSVDVTELAGTADIVVVAGAPATHAGDALQAVAAGAAAIVEAPLSTTLADADALVAAAAAGARVAYAENLLFAPLVREALHRAAALGPIQYLEARVAQRPSRRWSRADGAWGGGVLFDLGVHPLALMLTLGGADHPVSVRARFERRPSSLLDAVEDLAVVELQFASGGRGSLTVSTREDTPQWDLQLATRTSALRLELLPDPHLELHGVDLPRPPRRFPGVEPDQLETFGYLDQLWETGRDLAVASAAPWLGAAFGRYVLDVICGAYRSAGTGEAEPLPFRGPRALTPWQLWRGIG